MQTNVLLVGNDSSLASSRAFLLQRDGHCVSEVANLAALTNTVCADVALVVLCHSLSLDEKREVIEFIRHFSPRAMMLSLSDSSDRGELPDHAHASAIDGPRELIVTSRDLISRWEKYQA